MRTPFGVRYGGIEGLTLERVREILKRDRARRRDRGWYAGLGWAVADTIYRMGSNLDEWARMSIDAKYHAIAYYRTKDTMESYNVYKERTKPKKKR